MFSRTAMMAGAAVTFLSVTLAHVILRLRVAREIIGFLSVTDTYKHTYIHTYIHTYKHTRDTHTQ